MSGGACEGGVCQPFELVNDSTLFQAGYVAVDDTHVYWGFRAGSGSIARVPKVGGSVQPVANGLFGTSKIPIPVPSGGRIYFNSLTNIGEADADGSNKVVFEEVGETAGHMELADGRLYWSETISGTGTTIRSKTIGSKEEPTVWVSDDAEFENFRVAGGCVYYVSPPWLLRNCEPEIPTTASISVSAIEGDLLYLNETGVGVRRGDVSVDLFAPTVVSASTTSLKDIIADEDAFFFIDGSSGGVPACNITWSLFRQGRDDVSPTPLVEPSMDCPGSLAQDADSFYWRINGTNGNGQSIMKMAKPLP